MDVLRQLLEDARSVLKDMSRTQRASIMTMLITVASLLSFVVWVGSSAEDRGSVALPVKVEPSESKEIIEKLEETGYGPVTYNLEERQILVPLDKAREAVVYLAQEGLLVGDSAAGFEQMISQMHFSDPKSKTDEMMKVALQNEISRLVQTISVVKEAKIIYSGLSKKSLFEPHRRETATVMVKTKMGKKLDQATAETIISLVAAARTGLEKKDVEVADQNGRHFRSDSPNSLDAIAMKKYKQEELRNDRLRDKIETLCRAAIPGSEVWAFVDHKLNMDKIREHERIYDDGPKTSERTEARSMHSKKGPPAETGARPNIGRASETGGQSVEETTETEKIASRNFKPNVKDRIVEVAPKVEALTVSAVIHLPYKYIEEVGSDGKPVVDEGSGKPKRQKKSIDPLQGEARALLERNIRLAAGMLPGQDNVSVEIMQVPWAEPIESETEDPAVALQIGLWLKANVFPLLILFGLLFSVYVIYMQAKHSLPTDGIELPGEEGLSLSLQSSVSEEDERNASYEAMRTKLSDMIADNPTKSAALVRKWLKRENY